ncbi:MAG: SDR family oxidoreductase [Actinomycetota bacterium]|nr:SDR family oxidoreductase [Actinomycetota bacterium]
MGNLTFDFSGRTALVTGSARGIGLEYARFLALCGASVVLVDIDAEAVKRAAREVGAIGVVGDVSTSETAARAVAAALDSSGRLDILINNAGILRDGVVWKLTDEDWDLVMAVHAGGTFRMTRAAIPILREQKYGRIINVTSYTGLRGNVGQANYAMAKAGIIGFTKTVAKETSRFGVTVNAISPNAETSMIASIPEGKRRELASAIPMGYFADPADMCAAVGFLASEEAGYITGVVLAVDGGISI